MFYYIQNVLGAPKSYVESLVHTSNTIVKKQMHFLFHLTH